jgi:large subunit ribosomal protein L35
MKHKTKSGAKKRYETTGSGKIRGGKAANNHRLNPKNKRQKNLGGSKIVASKGDAKNLKRMLG